MVEVADLSVLADLLQDCSQHRQRPLLIVIPQHGFGGATGVGGPTFAPPGSENLLVSLRSDQSPERSSTHYPSEDLLPSGLTDRLTERLLQVEMKGTRQVFTLDIKRHEYRRQKKGDLKIHKK